MMNASERPSRYDRPTSSVASPREALRRAKYFSEDYLNKEFDIFWGLVSDSFLDGYYGRLFKLLPGGTWSCHGNSGLFVASTEISEMQMDNLSYNADSGVLVANELKLGGRKNPDQILKYALMYRALVKGNFISPGTRFILCFIGDRAESPDWKALIEAEVVYCRSSSKRTSQAAATNECIAIARDATFVSSTWMDLMHFNETYASGLDPATQQVEIKLLQGFNEALAAKRFLQDAGTGKS